MLTFSHHCEVSKKESKPQKDSQEEERPKECPKKPRKENASHLRISPLVSYTAEK